MGYVVDRAWTVRTRDVVVVLALRRRGSRSRVLLSDGSQRDTLTRPRTLETKLQGFSEGMRWTTRQPR